MKAKIAILLIVVGLFSTSAISAQIPADSRFFTFEDAAVPSGISAENGSVSISGRHFREGCQSLRWDFKEGGILVIRSEVPFEEYDKTGKDTYLSSFVTWLYNEQQFDGCFTFEFLKEGRICSHFNMGASFTGWRGAYLSYERDMEGTPETGMDEIRIKAPSGRGSVYVDHLITAVKIDSRYHSADVQLPFVNKETDNHWLLVYKHSLMTPDIASEPLTQAQISDMALIESRYLDFVYRPSVMTQSRMDDLKERFAFYQIRRVDGTITGRPTYMVRLAEAYERMMPDWNKDMFTKQGVEFKEFFDFMKDVAVGYHDATEAADKAVLRQMFLDLYDYITDLGVACGSTWGYCHHYGYNIRGLYPSYLLMKDVLDEEGKLDDAQKTMRWYAITNEILPEPRKDGIDIDTFNTHMDGRLTSILMMPDSPEKVVYLKSFARWFDHACRPAPGLSGSFKSDGACFHHCNNYPAYAVGGLDGATKALYCLSGTQFRISELAHTTVRNVLMSMRFYCNHLYWPLSMSGRHPNGGPANKLHPEQYALMALSGTPDGSDSIDKEMAAAYLRIEKAVRKPNLSEKRYVADFTGQGITAEQDPWGNLSLGYGCVSVQRRDNWMAVVRGHSRYLWSAEHYLPANFYGRYLGYAGLEILSSKDGLPATFQSSGWQEAGFDWNRLPGVTSVHLPFELLRAKVLNVDQYSGFEEMLYSDEAFAGGLSFFGEDGNFGIKLHGHDKYDGSFRARKSYHFFGNLIVCLGSDIEDADTDNNTETTIFQLNIPTDDVKSYYSSVSLNRNKWLADHLGNSYYLSPATMKKARFISAYPQTTVWERKEGASSGDWATLLIDHGKAPKGESYCYAVVPGSRENNHLGRPSYKVLAHNHDAHVVRNGSSRSYVLFESHAELPSGDILADADTSCLVMTEKTADGYRLSVCQPDLALYRGPSDEQYDQNGKRVERSIYSRPWISEPSREIPVTLVLRGRRSVIDTDARYELKYKGRNTVLTVYCKDAASFRFELK